MSNLQYNNIMMRCPTCGDIVEINIIIDNNITKVKVDAQSTCLNCREDLSRYKFSDLDIFEDFEDFEDLYDSYDLDDSEDYYSN